MIWGAVKPPDDFGVRHSPDPGWGASLETGEPGPTRAA